MSVNFYVRPAEVWQFFEGNKNRLAKELVLIAENDKTEYSVYLTEHGGYPLLSVYDEDVKLYEESATSEAELCRLARELCYRYLFSEHAIPLDYVPAREHPPGSPTVCCTSADLDDMIYEREDELRLATADYLMAVLRLDDQEQLDSYNTDLVDRVLDDFCRYLAEKLHISVYRPTWVADKETGCEVSVEYPYLGICGA